MRLVHRAPDMVEFRGRDAVRAPVWVGAAILLGPGCLSLFGPAPFTPLHVAWLAGLVAAGMGLIGWGFPRSRWVRIRPTARRLETPDGGDSPVGDDSTLRLMSVPTRGSSGNARYGIVLDRAGHSPCVLVAADAPDGALLDLAALRQVLPLRVVSGWGLPEGAPWIDEGPPPSHPLGRVAPWDDRAARRPVAATLLIGAAAITIAILSEIRGRIVAGDAPSAFSLALPVLGLSLLLLVTGALATHGVRLTLADALCCEERLFGFVYARKTVPRPSIRRAYLVSPSGHHALHLLLETTEGPVALPCDDVVGRQMAAALGGGASPATAADR